MSKTVEEWRPVVGYEGFYEVSDWGNVRSVDRVVEFYNSKKNGMSKRHFPSVLISKYKRGRYWAVDLFGKRNSIHRLVANAFLPNPENKPFVGHLKKLENGLEDETANEAWNLAWMTPSENNTFGTRIERAINTRKEKGNLVQKEESKQKISQSLKEFFKEHPITKERAKKMGEGHKKQLEQIDIKSGEVVRIWDSIKDAKNIGGFNHIFDVLNGIRKQDKGFTFRHHKNG